VLNSTFLPDESVNINYSAIFCQSDEEYERFVSEASQMGVVVDDTPTGPLYKFNEPFETSAGLLWLLKVRRPDPARFQRGDADFTLINYDSFKVRALDDGAHFKLIDRVNFEMIELRDPRLDVLCYFSSTPLTIQLGIE
jgi:hypothetical protein